MSRYVVFSLVGAVLGCIVAFFIAQEMLPKIIDVTYQAELAARNDEKRFFYLLFGAIGGGFLGSVLGKVK